MDHEFDPTVFASLGPSADVRTENHGTEQTRTCNRCGGSETVTGEGKGKAMTFPGYLPFYRKHIKCKAVAK